MLLLIVAAVAFSTGCATSGEVTEPPQSTTETTVPQAQEVAESPDAVSGATTDALWWEVALRGLRSDTITAKTYANIKDQAVKQGTYTELTVERKGVASTYQGIPLKDVVARVDGQDWQEPFVFDEALWNSGYDITLTAVDGYSATFSTAEVPADALFFYDEKDGESVLPGIVGLDVSSKLMVKELASIECALATEAAIQDAVSLEVVINGEQIDFSRSELTKTPYYAVGKGGFTTSAGTYYENTYGGIRLADFLSSFIALDPDSTVTLLATDGYSMSYSFSEISGLDNGVWILAFEMDGEYMSDDPGPFRGLRIARNADDPVPNIDGHSSPKMVKRIEISQEVYKDFSLLVKGKMESNLDRSTIQSGINCTAHKTIVEYYNKKTQTVETYTGIPLYALLAYGDDPDFAPHKQTDKNVLAYDKAAAQAGYQVKIIAGDGYSVTLDSREVDGNADVIIAMYQDDMELADGDWPLKLVWDQNAEVVPEGIKAVRNVVAIELLL